MEDDSTSDSETETFDVEFTASEIYQLHGILQYNSINMDYEMSLIAQTLAKKVHEPICSDEFSDAVQAQVDELEKDMEETPQDMMSGGIPNMGVQ